ncbi:MAG: hypothetical protein ACKOCV_07880 [Gemmatimonadota bacterium]
MSGRSHLKLGLASIGAVLFLVGVRRDDATLRWVGIGWFALAFLSRFLDRASTRDARAEDAADAAPTTPDGRPADA